MDEELKNLLQMLRDAGVEISFGGVMRMIVPEPLQGDTERLLEFAASAGFLYGHIYGENHRKGTPHGSFVGKDLILNWHGGEKARQ